MFGDSFRVPGTGAEVFLGPDGTGLVRTTAGRFLRLRSVPPELAYAGRLRTELRSREEADAERRWPSGRRRIAVVGGGAVVADLVEALREWGVAPVRFADAAALLAAPGAPAPTRTDGTAAWDLVLGYADSPAERAGWDQLDVLPEHGVAWVRAYREGEVCFVDPVGVTGDDPGSEQVRRRRLAASLLPREFDAWQRAAVAARETLPSTARCLLVSRVLTVILAWAQDSHAIRSYRTTLWKLVPATGTISEHPVLAYPQPAVAVDRGGRS